MARRRRKVKRILNCLPSPDQGDDWSVEIAREARLYAAAAPLPESVDLRAPWWKIGDQKKTGSCVGWAVADSVMRWYLVKAGRLAEDRALSVRFLWMAAKEVDELTSRPTTFVEREGTTLKAALGVAQRYGVVPDDFLPFGSGTLYQGSTKTLYAIAAQFRITAYVNLGVDLAQWRDRLANNGPIVLRIKVDETWEHADQTAGKLDQYRGPTDDPGGGHAAALVGYTPDYFIVRNSWGTSWGKDGFGYASPEYLQQAITESYEVVV